MTVAALKRLQHAEALAEQNEAEAVAAAAAAADNLTQLRAAVADLPQAIAAPLLDRLDTFRERLRESWQAEVARSKAWRALAEEQRPPCCAPGRPCKAELLAEAARQKGRFDKWVLGAQPRAFFIGGRRYLPGEDAEGCVLVRDAETGAVVAASKFDQPTVVNHLYQEVGVTP